MNVLLLEDDESIAIVITAALEAEGFTVNPEEWWHFDYKDWKQYPILNVRFEEIGQ